MDNTFVKDRLEAMSEGLSRLADHATDLAAYIADTPAADPAAASTGGTSEFWLLFTIFVLACFVGYYVVWRVTPALHSPLMAVTNAVSSVVIVGALIAAGPAEITGATWFGFAAVILASINIFGGFLVAQRMLSMFKKKS